MLQSAARGMLISTARLSELTPHEAGVWFATLKDSSQKFATPQCHCASSYGSLQICQNGAAGGIILRNFISEPRFHVTMRLELRVRLACPKTKSFIDGFA